jgi:L-threonylcarbamoyladenylate synthase
VGDPRLSAIDRASPDPRILERAARLIHEGEIVAAPSDTVYGLLALPRSQRARERLGRIKGRSGPFIVIVSSWEEARSWTRQVPEGIWTLLRKVWPGPVTVILPTAEDMPGAERGGIALRMPASGFLQSLLAAVGEPVFSTSANRSGQPPPIAVGELDTSIMNEVALVLDGGPADIREPSTIVDLSHEPHRVVRAGCGDAGALLDPGREPS